jgi:hypothetical protein
MVDSSIIQTNSHALQEVICQQLNTDDDPECWKVILDTVFADATHLCSVPEASRLNVFTEIGACSHWLRPHQCRWVADGGFAWPSGYGGFGWSLSGLPEFDWSIKGQWNGESSEWVPVEQIPRKKRLILRVAIPSRTKIHNQTAIHTIWSPGTPTYAKEQFAKEKLTQFYGFRRKKDQWLCTAYRAYRKRGKEDLYHSQQH